MTAAWYLVAAGAHERAVATHLLLVAIPAVAAAACAGTSRRRVGRWRVSWRLLAAGAASWAVGSVAWGAYAIGPRPEPPFPSVADAFYLASPVLVTAGLVLSPRFGTRRAALRSVLDGVMSAAALLVVLWPVTYRHGLGPDPFEALVGFAYPALDVVMIVAAVGVWTRLFRDEFRVPTALVAFATVQAATDAVYGLATAGDTYRTGQPIDLGWFASFALLAVAAYLARGVSTVRPTEHWSVASQLVPLVPVGAALVSLATTGAMGTGRVVATCVVVAAAAGRQLLLALELSALTTRLESEVAARSAELDTRERAYAALVHNSSDVIAVVDRALVIVFASDAVDSVLGYPAADVVGRRVVDLVHPDDIGAIHAACAALHADLSETVEVRIVHADGAWLFTECRLRREENDVLVNVRDVSARRMLEDKLRHNALTDSVTGLRSRAALVEDLERVVRASQQVGILLIDIDDFKVVNDIAGHAAGDFALREIADRIKHVSGPDATVARIGGDEFAVLVAGAGAAARAEDVARAVVASLREPVCIVERTFVVGASVGVATSSGGGLVADLLRHADLAMYAAKRNGKNQVALFSAAMHEAAVQFGEVKEQLRQALERDELVAHFQPIVRTRSGELVGFEALVRWDHPERGVLAPGEFLPVAEATGQVVAIGSRMLSLSCRQLASWFEAYPEMRDVSMSVNVDPQQLVMPLVDEVAELLTSLALPPHALSLEITERAFERHDEAVAVLRKLREVGVRVALDDFGTGYSSLSRLHEMPLDRVKIDRSFISEVVSGNTESPLALSALALCHALGVETLAEGVETPEQLSFLQFAGCDDAQGYLFAAALAPADATALVADIARHREWRRAASRASADAGEQPAAAPADAVDVDAVLRQALEASGLETAYLTDVDLARATQHVRRVAGRNGVNVFEGLSVAWNAALCRQMIQAGAEFVPDVRQRFPETRSADELGVRAFACIPIRGRDETILGTLCVASSRRATLKHEDLRTLHALADSLAHRL